MATNKIAHRVDSAADWASNNPTLVLGEEGIESDTGRRKVGDGTTAWTSLDYAMYGLNSSGNLVFPAGKGIDFSASEGGGATSSVLDDYEEGTWTPTDGGDSTGVLTSSFGFYRKIGTTVMCYGYFNVTTTFTEGILGGLPFAPTSTATGVADFMQGTIMNNNNDFILVISRIDGAIKARSGYSTDHLFNSSAGFYRFSFSYISD